MAELKTKATNASVELFIDGISESQKEDSKKILKMMETISGDQPKTWGSSIVGFVDTHLKYESGRELDWFKIGFSPRKNALTLYGLIGSKDQQNLLENLGKFTTGKGCLYIKKLEDINLEVLQKLIKLSL